MSSVTIPYTQNDDLRRSRTPSKNMSHELFITSTPVTRVCGTFRGARAGLGLRTVLSFGAGSFVVNAVSCGGRVLCRGCSLLLDCCSLLLGPFVGGSYSCGGVALLWGLFGRLVGWLQPRHLRWCCAVPRVQRIMVRGVCLRGRGFILSGCSGSWV